MITVEMDRYGDAGELQVRERPTPASSAERVRVRVHVRTVNVSDIELRNGNYPQLVPNIVWPAVLGWDFGGVLLDPTTNLAAGTRVAGFVPWIGPEAGRGTYAEVISVNPQWVAPVPDGVDLTTAAVLGMNGLTGAQAMDFVPDLATATVLVTGASGPVGMAAAVVATKAGATVYVAGSAGDARLPPLAFAGVIERADATTMADQLRGHEPDGVDVLFNPAIAEPEILGAVRDGGLYVSAHALDPIVAERGIQRVDLGVRADPQRLTRLLEGGLPSQMRVAHTFELQHAARAHKVVEAGGLGGHKVVLTS